MTKSLVVFCVLAVLICLAAGAWAETPVVIELFTSEGCSSCPPADALLVELDHKSLPNSTKLILMGEHVDYWDHDGWKDRFSSPAYTERQGNYARQFHLESVYTPQMVIDGHLQLVGNGATEVYRNIDKAASEPKPAQVSLQWESQQKLHIAVQTPAGERPKILLAITEDGLSTSIGGGENSGRTLQHAAVVRRLKELGTVRNGQFITDFNVSYPPDWNPAKLKVIVLVQNANDGRILGAASLDYQLK